MDVPRGRLEIGDYVGGQLCKAVMCQLPAVAMYRGSPPRNSRETLFYTVIQRLFFWPVALVGWHRRNMPRTFHMNSKNKQRVCELHRTGCVYGSSHPVGTGRRRCLFSRSTIYSLVFRLFDG